MHEHDILMNRCFELAEKGRGLTRSNPMVGALLYTNGQIIAEGFHSYYGGPHAEVNCINSLKNKSLLKDATLYISLEPCNFQGKTPPCTELILNSGIKQVVIGSVDFNPKVRNQGMDYLRSQEIEIINLNWEEKQKLLNIRFFINQVKNEPYIIGKLAYSNDNIIGRLGEKLKITHSEIDVLSHKLRSEVDAILVGRNTWENDQPSLNVRHYLSDFQPDILILQKQEMKPNITPDGRKISFISGVNPLELKKSIYNLGYKNVLVEGGADVFQFFMFNELLHEIYTIENQSIRLNSGVVCPRIPTEKYVLNSQKNYCRHQISQFIRHDLPYT